MYGSYAAVVKNIDLPSPVSWAATFFFVCVCVCMCVCGIWECLCARLSVCMCGCFVLSTVYVHNQVIPYI